MTQIRRLAPERCPRCRGEQTFVVSEDRVECSLCGYVHGAERPPRKLNAAPGDLPASRPRDLSKYRATYRIIHDSRVSPYVEAAYTTAMDYVHRQQWPDAIRTLYRCLEYQRDFTDAHLWLGRLLDDPEARRKHLKAALGQRPTLTEALRELMVLDGELTEQMAAVDEFRMPERVAVGGAVKSAGVAVRCPRCNSPRLADEGGGQVYCEFCGYRGSPHATRSEIRGMSFLKANLSRRAQSVVWVVGDRVLKCGACGSQRTLARTVLKDECPFCGSTQVIETDALHTFEQPDGLVPFTIDEDSARKRLLAALNSRRERLKGWFVENRVDHYTLSGVYLPFWVFDVIVDVSRTVIVRETNNAGKGLSIPAAFVPPRQYNERLPDFLTDVLVSGVESPPRTLIERAGRFDLSQAVPYRPELIAQHAAELYTLDFDRAGLDAHSIVSSTMRARHSVPSGENEEITVFPMIQQMTYRLLLLPLWSAVIHEVDGDARPALVNGQTGQVALGTARKRVRSRAAKRPKNRRQFDR